MADPRAGKQVGRAEPHAATCRDDPAMCPRPPSLVVVPARHLFDRREHACVERTAGDAPAPSTRPTPRASARAGSRVGLPSSVGLIGGHRLAGPPRRQWQSTAGLPVHIDRTGSVVALHTASERAFDRFSGAPELSRVESRMRALSAPSPPPPAGTREQVDLPTREAISRLECAARSTASQHHGCEGHQVLDHRTSGADVPPPNPAMTSPEGRVEAKPRGSAPHHPASPRRARRCHPTRRGPPVARNERAPP